MTEVSILCLDIQIPTEIDSSVLKWCKKSQNFISLVETFKFQLKKTVQHWNDFKNERTLHSFWRHSNSKWQNLTSFVGTFKFQHEKQFCIQMISNMTEPYIRFFVETFKFKLKNAVQYWNDFNEHITLHPLWKHSNPDWKRQFSMEIISNMTEYYIFCWDNQILTDKTLHPLLGHSNSN